MKGNTEEITGIKNINNTKIIIKIKVLIFLSFLFFIQSLIILKIIVTKSHTINPLEGCILYQVFYNLYTSLQVKKP